MNLYQNLALLLATVASVSCQSSIADKAKITMIEVESEATEMIAQKWGDDFKYAQYPEQHLELCIEVAPGESIQAAIDAASGAGGGVVKLAEGTYVIDEMITLKSNVTIVGEGTDKSIILQGDNLEQACINAEDKPTITDVVMKDLTVRGTDKDRVNGILIRGRNEDRHKRIMFQNVEVTNWGAQGVHIKRTDNIIMDKCTFVHNGSTHALYHNLYFLYNRNLLQSDCDFSYPTLGKGCKYTSCEYVLAQRCTIKECRENGIQADNEQTGYFFFHKYHVSGCGQVALWFPCEYYYGKYDYTEDPKFAPQNVILNRCEIVDNTWGAMWRVVNGSEVINSHFANKKIDMGLLKCEVETSTSTFDCGNEIYTDVAEWPEDVEILW
ncbi:MAG: glycosyl hydrolase family 28-related protein [Rikenellaceae bacterium]